MSLSDGMRLGVYEISGRIGAGGMGEVYRATDTKLGREVAIKTLPVSLATDADRLARFEREAKLLATLNHAHIAAVHSLGEHEGTLYIAMELVEGTTLEDKLKSGPLSIDDSLQLALQIASALEAAHEKGVVHRDLKPANVMVTPNGMVKVLDFGLAKAFSGDPNEASPGQSPALSMAMTQQGLILGTAGYMSPEQASGQATDQRADIWSFGVVLYEMLTGQALFSGESVAHILGGVLRLDPDWSRLPKQLDPRVRHVLERCLKKKPRERYHSIADVRLDLEESLKDPQGGQLVRDDSAAVAGKPIAARLAAAVAVTALIGLLAAWSLWPEPAARPVNRFDYAIPEGLAMRNTGRPIFALSPDGRQFVLNTSRGLLLRRMSELEGTIVPGSEDDMTNPFFSADGQSVAYYDGANDQLRRIGINGGAPVTIASNVSNPFGASWSADNTIFFGQNDGIYRVSANGGTPAIIFPVESPQERLSGPRLLPDGDSVLFSAAQNSNWDAADIIIGSLATGQRTVVHGGGSDARYLPSGHLLYAYEDDLFGIAFDLESLSVSGGPVPLASGLVKSVRTGAANYDIADDGSLVFYSGSSGSGGNNTLVWFDRAGNETAIGYPMCVCLDVAIAPDATRVAVAEILADVGAGDADLFMWSFDAETRTRVTFEPEFDLGIVWTPDSRRIVYGAGEGIASRAADGTGAIDVLADDAGGDPTSLDDEGNVIYTRDGDLYVLNRADAGGVEPLLVTQFEEYRPALSPDGNWLAYESDETGTPEIYVRPYPDVDSGRVQVSDGGGAQAAWSADGTRLYFLSPTHLMESAVEFEPTFRRLTPQPLFERDVFAGAVRSYAVSGNGERFLVIRLGTATADSSQARVVIVQNWTDELERLVPTQ